MASGIGILRSCRYGSGCWTLPVPEFFRETRITHFTKVKSNFTLVKRSTLLEGGEEYKEERNTYSRACARDNGPLGNKKDSGQGARVKRRLQRLHWDNCKVRFDEAVGFSFAVSALSGRLSSKCRHHYRLRPRLCTEIMARATDCQAIWDTGSTVSDARRLLAQTSRRFDPGQVDPQVAHQVRESLLAGSAPLGPKGSDPHAKQRRGVMITFFPAHWSMFAMVWLFM